MLAEKIQLEHDETILIYVRKHWFLVSLQIFGVVLAGIFPLIAASVLIATPLAPLIPEGNYTPLITTFYTAWLILCWMALFSIWTNYYLDVWTVTNKRLVTVDQQGLFHRDTGSFRLERLQDINVSIRGVLATFLKYGDLQAETASEDRDFVARGIPNPQELKALIFEAADKIAYNRPYNPANGEGA
jgi:uncharacterized membrane protein YdbT with pleckstrin-like domain